MAFVLDQVDHQIESAESKCQEANEQVVERMKSYRQAIQRRKTLDQLRERRFDEWRAETERTERKVMDEVALTRHARAEGPSMEE